MRSGGRPASRRLVVAALAALLAGCGGAGEEAAGAGTGTSDPVSDSAGASTPVDTTARTRG